MFKKSLAGLLSAVLIGLPPYEACAATLAAPVRTPAANLPATAASPLLAPSPLFPSLSLAAPALSPSLSGFLPVLAPLPERSFARTMPSPAAAKLNSVAAPQRPAGSISAARTASAAAPMAKTPRALTRILSQQKEITAAADALSELPAGGVSAAGFAIMDRILGERSHNGADGPFSPGHGLQTFDSEGKLSERQGGASLGPASEEAAPRPRRSLPSPQEVPATREVLPTTAAGQWAAALLTGGLAAGAHYGSLYLTAMTLTGAWAYAPLAATVSAALLAVSAIGYLGLGFRVMLARSGAVEAGDDSPMARPYSFFKKGGIRDVLFKPIEGKNAPYMPGYAEWTLGIHARVRAKAGKLLGFLVQTGANVRYLAGEAASFGRSLIGLFSLVRTMYRGDPEVKPFVKDYRRSVWTLQGINVFQAIMGVATSYVVGALIDAATAKTMGLAVMFAGGMVAIMLSNAALNTAYEWVKGRLTSNVLTSFRENLFGHLLRLPVGFFSKEKPSQVASRMSSDVANLATKNIGIPVILPYYGAMALFAGIMISITSWQTTLLVTLVAIPLSLVAHVYGNKAEKLNEAEVNRRAEMISAGEETLGRVRDIRAFATESNETDRYIGFVDRFIGTIMRRTRISSIYNGSMDQLYHAAFYLSVLFIGLFSFIAVGEPSIGQTMAMVGYAGYMRQALAGSLSLYTQYRETTGSSRRVLDYLKVPTAVVEAPGAVDPGRLEGGISFSGVNFSYDGKHKVLEGVEFSVSPGQHVALVGGEEGAKGALLDLIARLDEPTGGSVSFDGKNAVGLKLSALRRQLSLLHSDGIWIDGKTVRENLTYGPSAKPPTPKSWTRPARAARTLSRTNASSRKAWTPSSTRTTGV